VEPATPRRRLPGRGPLWRLRAEGGEQLAKVFTLGGGQRGEVAVAQHLLRARGDFQLVLTFATPGVPTFGVDERRDPGLLRHHGLRALRSGRLDRKPLAEGLFVTR